MGFRVTTEDFILSFSGNSTAIEFSVTVMPGVCVNA